MEEQDTLRDKLISNRHEISTKAEKEIDASTRRMLGDISFIGFLGAGLTTIFNAYGGSTEATTVMGVSFACLASASLISNSFKKDFLNSVSNDADVEATCIENGEDITSKRVQSYTSYKDDCRKNYKSKIGSVFNVRSIAIGCALASALTFLSTTDNNTEAKRDEETDILENNQGLSLCVGSGDDRDCVEITLTTPSLTR